MWTGSSSSSGQRDVGRRRGSSRPDFDGVLIVDKPVGPTSHDVVDTTRRALRQRRVGHTGTLDPGASGVLVLCLGRATKLVRFLQASRKTYSATMILGVETDTQDADGEVVATTPAAHVDERTVCEVLTRFQGTIEQVPPMVSALRVNGERLHELARRGEVVEREPRPVTVHDLILDAYIPGEHPEVSFLVTCSPGTYVRTLAHDVGRALGVGASLTSLRRVANGQFVADEAVSPDAVAGAVERGELERMVLTPLDAVSRSLPVVDVDDPPLVLSLARGGSLPASGIGGWFGVRAGERLIGVYADRGEGARPELVWTRPEELG